MNSYEVLRALIEAKAPHDVLLVALNAAEKAEQSAIEMMERETESRRSKGRDRWQKWKQNQSANVSKQPLTLASVSTPTHVSASCAGSNTLSSEPKGSSEVIERKKEREETRVTALAPSEFEEFWKLYPNKVGKPKAKISFSQARKRADLQTIMDGLQRYVGKTDDRPWCNPTTFLNQDRWGDEPAQVPISRQGSPPEGRRTPSHALMEMATGTGKYANLFKRRNDETDFSASSEFPRLISG